MTVIISFDNNNNIILNLNNPKKKGIKFNLTKDAPHLADIIKTSCILFPGRYVFTNYDSIDKKTEVRYLSKRIDKIFRFTYKTVGVNSLRSCMHHLKR